MIMFTLRGICDAQLSMFNIKTTLINILISKETTSFWMKLLDYTIVTNVIYLKIVIISSLKPSFQCKVLPNCSALIRDVCSEGS